MMKRQLYNTDKEIEDHVLKVTCSKLNTKMRSQKQCDSMSCIVTAMEETEKFKIEGNRKRDIVKRVLEAILVCAEICLPQNVSKDLNDIVKSDKIDNILSVIVLASKGIYKLNIHSRIYNLMGKCFSCC